MVVCAQYNVLMESQLCSHVHQHVTFPLLSLSLSPAGFHLPSLPAHRSDAHGRVCLSGIQRGGLGHLHHFIPVHPANTHPTRLGQDICEVQVCVCACVHTRMYVCCVH